MTGSGPVIGPLLRPLACPACGREFQLGPADRVAACPPCSQAYFLGETWRAFPLLYMVPRLKPEGLLRYLPFWRAQGLRRLTGPERTLRAYANLPDMGILHIPAFWMPRLAYFEDLTWRFLTLADPPAFAKTGRPLTGGVRDPGLIPELARLTMLGFMDRVADVGEVEATFDLTSLAYVGIPFFSAGEGWTDGMFGARFPPNLLMDS